MTDAQYEYDVAFSFHAQDEGVATQLNDLLQDRFKTFLYSKKQEVLAGADGEEKFNAVFGKKARCVVVFYRKEWGETPFTRIEQTAIRNRAFELGYEFTVFIPTDKSPTTPEWLPKTRLYVGLERFGLQGAAAVIEQRIQELGGEPRVESITDRAARLERANTFAKAKKQFHDNEIGVQEAGQAFTRLTTALQTRVTEIAAANPSLNNLKVEILANRDGILIYGLRETLYVYWRVHFRNSLDDSLLGAEVCAGNPKLPGFRIYDDARKLLSIKFDYRLLALDRHGYVERGKEEERSYSADELADRLLHVYMNIVDQRTRHSD